LFFFKVLVGETFKLTVVGGAPPPIRRQPRLRPRADATQVRAKQTNKQKFKKRQQWWAAHAHGLKGYPQISCQPMGWSQNAYDRFMAEPWEGLAVNPRNADTTTVRLATYNTYTNHQLPNGLIKVKPRTIAGLLFNRVNRKKVILSVCLPT
jgi:hypothetical protein